jgi:hypothetical protein
MPSHPFPAPAHPPAAHPLPAHPPAARPHLAHPVLARAILCAVLAAAPALAQPRPPAANAATAALQAMVPQPRPEDVASIPALLTAVYDTISGPAGTRDWIRFRSLFLPGARLTRSTPGPDGITGIKSMNVAEFIAAAGPVLAKEGFYETGLVNRVDRFGGIAQIFTSYESRHATTDAPFQRGINSMQFVSDGQRWWIVSILWDIERAGNPLPPAMTPPK